MPLQNGITDEVYQALFRPVIAKVVDVFRPEAIVLQCGAMRGEEAACRVQVASMCPRSRDRPAAPPMRHPHHPPLPNPPLGSDSLAGDRLGVFNLSSQGHASCVEFVRSLGIPLLLLGGGGYKIVNVSRCWARETSVAVGRARPEARPPTPYYEYYAPSYQLTVPAKAGVQDRNTREYLHHILQQARLLVVGLFVFLWGEQKHALRGERASSGSLANGASTDGPNRRP